MLPGREHGSPGPILSSRASLTQSIPAYSVVGDLLCVGTFPQSVFQPFAQAGRRLVAV